MRCGKISDQVANVVGDLALSRHQYGKRRRQFVPKVLPIVRILVLTTHPSIIRRFRREIAVEDTRGWGASESIAFDLCLERGVCFSAIMPSSSNPQSVRFAMLQGQLAKD